MADKWEGEMDQIVTGRLKRVQLLLLIAAFLLFLGGCGKEEVEGVQGLSDMATHMSGGVDTGQSGSEDTAPDSGIGQGAGIYTEPAEISRKESDIAYAGDDFMKSCATVGGDSIYVAGFHGEYAGTEPKDEDYFWGRIEKEGNVIQEFTPDIPDDMFAMRGCVDLQGNWHILCVRKVNGAFTYEKAGIWIIDSQGNTVKNIDFTEIVQTKKFVPYWMAVDGEGNYILGSNGVLMLADSEGHVKKWYEIELQGLGIGKSGRIYGVYGNLMGEVSLGILEPEAGVLEQCAVFDEELYSSFSVLQPGVNTELLLANKGNGVWCYDGEELESVISIHDILGNGQDISAMGFMDDGRLCVMSNEDGQFRFYYVPVEEEK